MQSNEVDWQTEVDRAEEAEWSQMLELFNDASIYQTWSYGSVHWGEKELSHLVLRCRGEVAGIAQLRIIRPTPLNFGMAYLRWGPVCQRRDRSLDPEVYAKMARALEDEYVCRRKLFLRILPNAFGDTTRAAAIQAGFNGFTSENAAGNNIYRTFLLNLAPEVEQLRKNLDKKWRNQLSRAEKNNLSVTVGSGIEEYRTFCEMYKQMRNRKTFKTAVDIEEFGRMQRQLPNSQRMQVFICEQGGRPVAGLVASALGDTAIYVLGATSDEGLDSKGAYLLQWTLIKRLKEEGIQWYDLGGIDPIQNPGVYHFKKGLSGADVVQLSPIVACTSEISSAVVRTGMAIRDAIRGYRPMLRSRTPLSTFDNA